MKAAILTNLSQFDQPEPEWCLPPRFWERAELMSAYQALPLGRRVDLPHRKCHFSAIRVYRMSKAVAECSLEIVTGYAFAEGKWFRHSWVVNPPDFILLECTPTQFDSYFGARLTQLESQQWAEIIGYDQDNSLAFKLHRGKRTFNSQKIKKL